MGRSQTFISALLLIVMLSAWFLEGDRIRESYALVSKAKTARAAK